MQKRLGYRFEGKVNLQMGIEPRGQGAAFLPSDLSGLILWLRADQISGLNDGDPISTWEDQSGNGNDATQAGVARPTYRTNVQNGLPAVRFDNVDDNFNLTGMTNLASDYSLFVAVDPNLSGPNADNYIFDTQTGRLIYSLANNGPTPGDYQGFFDAVAWESYGAAITAAWHYCSWILTADPSLFRDGAELVAQDADNYIQRAIGGNVRIGSDHIGTGAFYNGDMGEIIIYNNVKSVTDRQSVESYLSRWA